MFKKLRNKIIGISMLTTTIVLFIAFSTIYFVASTNIKNRPIPKPPINFSNVTQEKDEQSFSYYSEEFNKHIENDRKESLESLLVSLIATGVSIEVLIFFLSLYLANQSIKPIKETYNAQKQFIANASHEIKTPLAVIRANLEAADIKNNEWIDNAMTKTEELAELNNQLLTLARIDANTYESKKETIDISDFVSEIVAPLKPQLDKKKIKLSIICKTKRSVSLDKTALRQVLNILLDNAIKYCDKKIDIIINDHEIIVKNDGTTIDKEKISHLFERFYQVDKTKNGVGLGLAIAKETSDKNNWKLSADSDKKSTSFMVKI